VAALLCALGLAASTGAAAGASASVAAAAVASPAARIARSVYIVETASLKQTGEGDSSLDEKGHVRGTFSGPISARLSLSANHVSAVFTLYPKGGSITGVASARYVVSGSTAYYGGTFKVVRGTGAFRKARSPNIGISGTINRYNFALTVKAHGSMWF
jgi:hypothetical protein